MLTVVVPPAWWISYRASTGRLVPCRYQTETAYQPDSGRSGVQVAVAEVVENVLHVPGEDDEGRCHMDDVAVAVDIAETFAEQLARLVRRADIYPGLTGLVCVC